MGHLATLHIELFNLKGIAFSYGSNVVINKKSGQKIESKELPQLFNSKVQTKHFKKTLVLGPKLFGITKFPEKALLLEGTILKTLEKGMYLNAIQNIILPHHTASNNSFDLAEEIKSKFPLVNIILFEPTENQITSSVLKKGVNFVVHELSSQAINGALGNPS